MNPATLRQNSYNTILQGDSIERLAGLPEGSVDLAFADPPFNIGYQYDVYDDKQERSEYLGWSRRWIESVYRVLSPTGTFWLAIGDEYAAELKLLSQDVGFHPRSWVIWYYTFGVNCKNKFSRSHAHLFYFTKDSARFTFRSDELENRIPSARQLVYADNRANPKGRLPDDTWVLRPQDLAGCFTTEEDTWYFPRVAGTFKERAGFHGCQMPEQLLGRIIRLCSEPGALVLDPFSGSATTVAVAKKLGRRYLAFDISPEYVARGLARLDGICVGDPLDGAAEPTVSAPATPGDGSGKGRLEKSGSSSRTSSAEARLVQDGLLAAFREVYDGYSLDRLVADPAMNLRLAEACRSRGLPGEPRSWNWMLFGLRKAGALVELPTTRRTHYTWQDCEPYLFASEIAWRQMFDRGAESLDQILCDPLLAAEFDELAGRWAPGYSPLEYRWAAIKLRKSARQVRGRAELLAARRPSSVVRLDAATMGSVPEQPGVYLVVAGQRGGVYAGQAANLRRRLAAQFGPQTRPLWKQWESLSARFFPTTCAAIDRLAYQHRLVRRYRPLLNRLESTAS